MDGSRKFVVVPAPKDNGYGLRAEDDWGRRRLRRTGPGDRVSVAQEMIPFSACSFGRMQAMRSSCQSPIHAGAVARGAKGKGGGGKGGCRGL